MRKSLNQVQLIGNVGRDPEMRYTPSGKAVANFSLATNYGWQGADGEWQNETEWHNITVWGKLAESSNTDLSKGSRVFVQGRLKTEKWTTPEGVERTKVVVVADTIVAFDKGNGSGEDSQYGGGFADSGDLDLPF